MILEIAERLGQLPETIENEMSEYWFDRYAVKIHGQSLNNQRVNKEIKARTK